MLIPGRNKQSDNTVKNVSNPTVESEKQVSLQELLTQTLEKVEGAGKVQVLLTVAEGEESIYQTDVHTSISSETNTTQMDTVIISNTERGQSGLLRQINPPVYLGAVIVCQGADSPSVRLAIVDAVSKVTGLGADRISVIKMK